MNYIEKTFMVACKEFFGFHPNQKLSEFAAEIKQLSAEERAELSEMFLTVGIKITN